MQYSTGEELLIVLIDALLIIFIAFLVYLDGIDRNLSKTESFLWCLGTIILIPIFLPLWFFIRPKCDVNNSKSIAVLIMALFLFVNALELYTIQPINSIPNGATLLVWRNEGEPFFNSPDTVSIRSSGEVSLPNPGVVVLANAPQDRVIVKFPYIHIAYLISTTGNESYK